MDSNGALQAAGIGILFVAVVFVVVLIAVIVGIALAVGYWLRKRGK